MAWRLLPVLLSLAVSACSRTGLDSVSPSQGASDAGVAPDVGAACPSTPPAPDGHCITWRASRAPQLLSAPPPAGSAIGRSSIVLSGCGVLAAWSTETNPSAATTTLAWSTRVVGFDGTPLADVRAHPVLTSESAGSGAVALAASGARVGALVSDSTGCKFTSFDPNGANDGNGVTLANGNTACLALTGVGDGFTFMTTTSDGASPASLVTIDALGAQRATTSLGVAANRAVWDRLVFDDGSFLLYTFREDPVTAVYTSWLQHFDARGTALAPEVTIANTAPVLLAKALSGALAAWEPLGPGGPRIEVAAIDRDGNVTGSSQALPSANPIYGLSLVPVPDGDVILVWLEDTGSAKSGWTLSARALGPDGVPRGPGTVVLEGVEAEPVQGLVEKAGARALLVFGAQALPLECGR